MYFIDLPIFILLFAFVYLSIVYGLLKIAENQKQSENTISDQTKDVTQRIKTP